MKISFILLTSLICTRLPFFNKYSKYRVFIENKSTRTFRYPRFVFVPISELVIKLAGPPLNINLLYIDVNLIMSDYNAK